MFWLNKVYVFRIFFLIVNLPLTSLNDSTAFVEYHIYIESLTGIYYDSPPSMSQPIS